MSNFRKVILASLVGTTIEAYDFLIYGTAAATIFNKLFFPTFSPFAGTMAAFSTYAVGFLARPLGSVVFGHYGDKLGRKSALIVTLTVTGLATFAVGLLPTYASIGLLAPAALVLLRFAQGFAMGGEWGGAVLMVVEHGGGERRGFYASFPQAGVPAGLFISALAFRAATRLPETAYLAWGWRVPFLLSIVLVGVGLFIRLKILESPLFDELKREKKTARMPVLELFKRHPKNVLLAMGAKLSENIHFYIFTVFIFTYVGMKTTLPGSVALDAILISSALSMLALPFFGALSDRVGRKPVYMAGAIALILYAFPFFALAGISRAWAVIGAVALGLGVFHAAMYGAQAPFFAELFGTSVRYSGASLGYHVTSAVGGGLAPLAAAYLLRVEGGQPWLVSVYLIAASVVTLTCVALAPETHRIAL